MGIDTIIDHIKHCKDLALDEKLDESSQPNIHISCNIFNQAEGSSVVRFNNTIVSCGLKVKVHINPNINQHKIMNKGILVCNVELTPLCSKNIQLGLPGEEAQALTDQMQTILSNNGPDLSKLVIQENRAVYVLHFDFIVLNHGGYLLDACVLAANAVLMSAKFPKVSWNIDNDNAEIINMNDLMTVPVQKLMYSITYGLIESKMLLNVNEELENGLNDQLDQATIFVNEDGNCMMPIVNGCLDETKRSMLKSQMDTAVVRMRSLHTLVSSCS